MNAIEILALDNEAAVRTGAFAAIFALVLLAEWRLPRRVAQLPRRQRWSANLGLFGLNVLVLRLLFPAAAVGLALSAREQDWGLLNRVDLPYALEVLAAVLVLDLAIYWQHRLMHRVPLLWRLHRVHHADPDFDLTTAQRFHTLEILLSMAFKWVVILLLGPPLLAVLVFEVLLNGMATFNHGNVRLPPALDRLLRLLLVTPDMHRVHHSIRREETDSNYGFNLSFWDRLFGSYTDQPRDGHRAMTIGIAGHRDPREVARLPGLLALPFRGDPR